MHLGDKTMANTNDSKQTSAAKSMVAGGIWRSRRIVAVAALAGAMSFGFVGSQVHQAGATISWCRNGCFSSTSIAHMTREAKSPVPYTISWCRNGCYQQSSVKFGTN